MSNLGNREVFAENLKFYVKRSGRTQKEVAEVVGVAYSTFNDWVKGKKYPRMDKVEILANYFGVLKSDLIEDKQKQSTDGELSARKKAFMQKVEKMTDAQIEKLEQILSLVENNNYSLLHKSV